MRAIKVIFNALKSLSLKKLWRLFVFAISHPLFITLGFIATIIAFKDAQKLYPKSASNNGRGNAFRHSYWCCLILMYCCKISSPKKSLAFCKQMTDMHEELFPNLPLETKMDLHNNAFGIRFFEDMLPGVHRQFFERNFFIEELKKKTAEAVVLKDVNQELGNYLVYLEE